MTVEELRAELHASIDRAVNDYLQRERAVDHASAFDRALTVEPWREVEPFDYPWPTLEPEPFDAAFMYRITDSDATRHAVLAWTTREAWSKKDRRRAVVFHAINENDPPSRWYPWTEFVETDDGRYAAPVPDPKRPRATLADLDALPLHLEHDDVERSDALFDSINNGPSLRRVVQEDDAETMIRHGYWVASLRKRL